MADINHVVLVGRLVRDATLKYTNAGLAICEFSVAVNNRKKQGDEWVDEAHFFDVTLFGRHGEAIQKYLTQGKPVGVDGQLRQDRWQTAEGQNRSKVAIVANNVMLIGGQAGGASAGRRPPQPAPGAPAPATDFGQDDFPDGIPF